VLGLCCCGGNGALAQLLARRCRLPRPWIDVPYGRPSPLFGSLRLRNSHVQAESLAAFLRTGR